MISLICATVPRNGGGAIASGRQKGLRVPRGRPLVQLGALQRVDAAIKGQRVPPVIDADQRNAAAGRRLLKHWQLLLTEALVRLLLLIRVRVLAVILVRV